MVQNGANGCKVIKKHSTGINAQLTCIAKESKRKATLKKTWEFLVRAVTMVRANTPRRLDISQARPAFL